MSVRPEIVAARISEDRTLLSVTFDGPLPDEYDDGFSIYPASHQRVIETQTWLCLSLILVILVVGIVIAANVDTVLGWMLVGVAAAAMTVRSLTLPPLGR